MSGKRNNSATVIKASEVKKKKAAPGAAAEATFGNREVIDAEKLHFKRICNESIITEKTRSSIGTYSEKTLHSVLKLFICDDKSCHEIKIYSEAPDNSGSRESGYIADVLTDCDIYEIQTGGFYPLRDKIKFYLEETSYNVKVVYPVAARKWVSWIDPATGGIGKRSPSPKKGSEKDVLPELFWLIPYLNSRRLTVRLMLLGIEEFRMKNGWGNDGKRGSERYERIPTELYGIHDFSTPADYIDLLPDTLPAAFTAGEFGKLMKLKGKKLYAVLKVFCAEGLIAPDGMSGRAVRYIKK